MPKNVPPELEEKFKKCKEEVMAKGESEESAYGICYVSVVEGKSIEEAIKDYQIQQAAKKLINDDTVVFFGDAVKELGNGKVGGYLIHYGSPKQTDLTELRDYFEPDTDFDLEFPAKVTTYYNHGQNPMLKKRKLGKAEVIQDDFGLFAQTFLNERDEYERFLLEQAKAGKLGWSSGTAYHLMEREEVDGAHKVTFWPIVEASLTNMPAEPLNHVVSLKSLSGLFPVITKPKGEAEAAGAAPSEGIVTQGTQDLPVTKLIKEIDMDKDELKAFIDEQRAETVKAVEKAFVDGKNEVIKSLPTTNAAGVQVTQDEADKPFAKMGDFLGAVKAATLTQGRELAPRLKALNLKALGANELIGSEGGFLLEPAFAAGLLTPLHDTGPFSSRANKLEIGPNANGVTVRAVDETDRAAGSRWGGIQGYRLAEAGTKTASQPTFRLVELRLKKYAVLCYATDELLADVTALAGIINQGCAEELDFMVNDDILNGLGAAGPLGILASGALVSVSKETGQTAATIVTENIFKMWARMHPRSKGNAVWYINTDVTPQLYALSLSVGTGGMPLYMAPGSLPDSPSGRLMGRPVVETEFNATLGTVGDIVLADMSQYALIDRDVQAASSIHVQFLTDQTAYRFVYRCDGQPKNAKPLTPYKGSGTLSPFVALATRA